MLQEIISQVEDLLEEIGVGRPIELTTPPNPELGDIALPCFGLAKQSKKSPVEIARELSAKLSPKIKRLKIVERVEPLGPYVNFYLSTPEVARGVVTEIEKKEEEYGSTNDKKKFKVMIEYPSNNTHKEFHIGHFRNVCIGNTLVQLYGRSGAKVFPVNYLNDFGAHVAKCLWGLTKFHGDETPPENKQKWLGEIYAEASNYLKEHPEAGAEVAEIQKRLEAHDKKLWPLFSETRQWSIDKFNELFEELGVRHAAVFYEKDLKVKGQKIVDQLLKKKIAEVGEGGAIIIDLKKYNLDVALLRKSNGVGLYLTSDVPLAYEKFKKFNVDESIVITAQEQTFYFKQLYKILELLGFEKKLTHLAYGLVNLPEGKMSSRTGKVVLYEDLRDLVREKIREETVARHADWPKEKIDYAVEALTMAALKFDMQKHEAIKNITFDIKEATSFDGFSGPYALYAVARINSILRKGKGEKGKVRFELLSAIEEKKLVLLLAQFEEMIGRARHDYNPSVVARYCFDLAQAFNEFYNKHSILSAENTDLVATRLALARAVKQVLVNALHLLTIETIEEM